MSQLKQKDVNLDSIASQKNQKNMEFVFQNVYMEQMESLSFVLSMTQANQTRMVGVNAPFVLMVRMTPTSKSILGLNFDEHERTLLG